MSPPELAAQIEVARNYESFFVPALFHEWGPRLAEAAQVRGGGRVLDVACGTGVAARAAAAVVGPTGHVAGLDLKPGMLAVARELAPEIEWREGSADALPFPDASFDAVVSQFGLMFFPDRPRALREMWRVLRPGGRMAVAVWASLETTPAYATEIALVERLAGAKAADALRAPFALGDPADLAALWAEAGLELTLRTIEGKGRFPSIRALVEIDLRGWLPLVGVDLGAERIELILAEAESAFRPFRLADGRVEFASPAHIVTTSRP